MAANDNDDGTQLPAQPSTGLISAMKRSPSTMPQRRFTNSMQGSRISIAGMSSSVPDDVFDELDELDASDNASPVTICSISPPPTARTINVMISPSEPLFFNCADPCDGGEQIALFRTISKEAPFSSDVWPECSPDEVETFENEEQEANNVIFSLPEPTLDDEDYYADADFGVSDLSTSPGFSGKTSRERHSSIRSRRVRHVSEHSIPKIRRMTSSLLTTPAMRRSVLVSVGSACAGDLVDPETPRGIDEKPSMIALTPISRTRSVAHAKLQRAMSKSAEFQTGWKRFKGVFLALAAGFVFTFSAIAQKYLLSTMNYAQIGLVRFLLLIFFMSPSFVIRRLNPFSVALIKQHGPMLLLRGIIGGFCFQMRTYAFQKLPIGDATVIMFSSPIFVGLIAKLVLNEKYQKIYFVTMLATLLGCVLISRPKFIFEPHATSPVLTTNVSVIIANETTTMPVIAEDESDGRLIGSLVALLSAFLAACTFVVLRKLRRVDAVIVVFYFGFVGSIISFGLTLVTPPYTLPMPTSLMEYWWIFVLAGSSNVGQWLFTRSLHYENANLVSLMRTVDIVWAFAAQMLLFNVLPHYLSILGTTIVTLSVVFLGLRKLFESLDDDNAFKARFMQYRVCVFCLFPPPKTITQQQQLPPPLSHARRPTLQRKPTLRRVGSPDGGSGDTATALFARSISAASNADRKTVTFPHNHNDDNDDNEKQQTVITQQHKTNNMLLVESDEGIALSDNQSSSSPERFQQQQRLDVDGETSRSSFVKIDANLKPNNV